MKNFLLVLFGFLYFQASSQIQLDSIIYYDISSSAKVNSIKYEYNSEQQLITYYEDGVKIELEYNDNNDINKLLITEDYYMDFLQTWNLKYDDQNLLDSIIIDFPEYYGMDNFDIYDLKYNGTKLVEVINSYYDYGMLEYSTRREYLYTNDLLDRINLYIIDFDQENFNGFIQLDYNNINNLQLISYFNEVEELYFRDTLIYNANNSLINLKGIYNYNGNEETSYSYNYTSASGEKFSEITSPKKFYDLVNIFSPYELTDISLALTYSDKVESHETSYDEEAIWYYSVMTDVQDERIVATPISVYPNPTAESINIDIEATIRSVKLYGQNGSLIEEISDIQENTLIVDHLLPANYTLVAVDENGQYHFSHFIKI